MINYYLENGYADMHSLMGLDVPIIFIIGGRGTGKTYGALKELLERNEKFILMRRTQAQCDVISKKDFSPFRALQLDDPSLHITVNSVSKYNAAFSHASFDDNGKEVAIDTPFCYSAALSTIANLRGFDASDVNVLLYDEFIGEKHERPITNEGAALLNAYETINRNRELQGREPLKLIGLSNSNDMNCPIFYTLNIVSNVEKMARSGKSLYLNHDRGIAVIMLQNSPISDRKRNTALYRLTSGSKFEDMALNNKFSGEDFSYIGSRPLQEFKPLVAFDDLCVYVHKSKNEYYVTAHISGTPPLFYDTDIDRKHFRQAYRSLYAQIIAGNVVFSNYYAKNKLTNVLS